MIVRSYFSRAVRLMMRLVIGTSVAAVALLVSQLRFEMSWPEARVRHELERAVAAHDHAMVVRLSNELVRRKLRLGAAGEPLVRAYLATDDMVAAGNLLLAGVRGKDTVPLLLATIRKCRAGDEEEGPLALRCAERAFMLDGTCIEALTQIVISKKSHGLTHEIEPYLSKILSLDPGNLFVPWTRRRLAAMTCAGEDTAQRRSVTFTCRLPRGSTAYLAGSWDRTLHYSQLTGWEPRPMERVRDEGDGCLWTTKLELGTGHRWYSAMVSTRPDGPAVSLARFPVLPNERSAVAIDMEQHKVQLARPFLAARAQRRSGTSSAAPRTVVLCIDGETWDVAMPMIRAGLMPHTRWLLERGTVATLFSSTPVTIPAFNLVNFGAVNPIGLGDYVNNGLEVLKEKGLLPGQVDTGNLRGRPNAWQALAQSGLSVAYTGLADQLHYQTGGLEQQLSLDVDARQSQVAERPYPGDLEMMKCLMTASQAETMTALRPTDRAVLGLALDQIREVAQGRQAMERTGARVALMHIKAIDTSYHMLWGPMEDTSAGLSPATQRYAGVVAALHRLLDLQIGELLAGLDMNRDSLVIWSDHGSNGGLTGKLLGHDHRGIGLFAGRPFAKGTVLQGSPDLSQLMPTLFAALGSPCPPSHAAPVIAGALGSNRADASINVD